MARNVEIKARLDDAAETRRLCVELADGGPQVLRQTDVFFHCTRGRLKLRTIEDDHSELIAYERPDTAGPKTSTYSLVPVPDPNALQTVLANALGVAGMVRKIRTLYMAGQTRIHLDEVNDLGDFLELEVVLEPEQSADAGEKIAEALLGRLGIRPDQLISGAYFDLLKERKASSK